MRKLLLGLSMLMLFTGAFAQSGEQAPANDGEHTVSFRFVPGDDMFYIPWEGIDAQLAALYAVVDEYRTEIASGSMPVYVDGYSSSMKDGKRNLELSFIRANRVKSELIIHKGLTEDNFVTKNYTTAYTAPDGTVYKDMVVVTFRIPAKPEPQVEVREIPQEPVVEEEQVEVVQEPVSKPQPVVLQEPVDPWNHPYCLAVRTNLLYDSFLLPTLGVEWRASRHVGVKLDGSLAWWGDEKGKVQKIWLVSPEVRWYLTPRKRLYVGVGGNYAEYNAYKYMLGGLFSSDTGYQGTLWSAGAVVGYQLDLCRSFALDFNLGFGYTRSEYDSFNMVGDTRVSKAKDQTKDFWGPTQAGVSLVWKLGGNR